MNLNSIKIEDFKTFKEKLLAFAICRIKNLHKNNNNNNKFFNKNKYIF